MHRIEVTGDTIYVVFYSEYRVGMMIEDRCDMVMILVVPT